MAQLHVVGRIHGQLISLRRYKIQYQLKQIHKILTACHGGSIFFSIFGIAYLIKDKK